jgi:hydroxyacid-oxoacid transhydrogenase
MHRTHMPNGLHEVGYEDKDVDALVQGTLPQHRVTKLAPRAAEPDDLRQLFMGAMRYWE